jgi:hypothetical protein
MTIKEPGTVPRGERVTAMALPLGDHRGKMSSSVVEDAISRTAPPLVDVTQRID